MGLSAEKEISVATLDKSPAHFRWKMKEGDDEAITVEFDFALDDYTDWKGQLRPAPGATPVVDLHIDDSQFADNKIRFYLLGDNPGPGEVLASMDGWGGDIQVINPDGQTITFLDLAIQVEPQYTMP